MQNVDMSVLQRALHARVQHRGRLSSSHRRWDKGTVTDAEIAVGSKTFDWGQFLSPGKP